MKSRALAFLVCLLVSSLSAELGSAQDTGLMNVVFLGDSITQAGAAPDGFVTLIADALKQRHEKSAIEVIGAGISGNKVPDLQARLERDVLSKSPGLVVIYIGINDVWHSLQGNGTPIDRYESGLDDLIDRIHAAGAKIILCTPSVIGEKTDGSNQLDAKLDEYSAVSRRVAQKHAVMLLDLRKLFLAELKNRNPENATNGVLTRDGVHLTDAGNQFVKDCMLPSVESVLFAQAVKHVVLVKFKPTTTVAQINEVCDSFAQLPKQIDCIQHFEGGTDVSVENRAQGYTHCFVLSFASLGDRDTYIVHPAHEAFKKTALPYVESILVFDYLAQ